MKPIEILMSGCSEGNDVTVQRGKLIPRVLFAMPEGPPYGGMTTYTSVFLKSNLFASGNAFHFDTSPPEGAQSLLMRSTVSMRFVVRLISQILRDKPDITYFMTSSYLGFYEKAVMGLVCKAMCVKVVFHFIGGGLADFYTSSKLNNFLIRFFLHFSDGVVVLSEQMRDLLSNAVSPDKLEVIYNPVVLSEYVRIETRQVGMLEECVQVLFCSAIIKSKGILDFLDAVRIVSQSSSFGMRVTIIGTGDLVEACQSYLHTHKLNSFVETKQFVDEETKRKYINSADIFVLPSYVEGIPLAILEAMAAKSAVIATNVGGIPTAVVHGETGILVSPGDVEGIARALVQLIKDAPLRRAMGERGHQRVVKHFDSRIIMNHFIQYFNRLHLRRSERVAAAEATV
jgi:glycosyltransferase involved in cell wall biosynthesis